MARLASCQSSFRLLACLVVALAAVALPAEKAAARTWEYCVKSLPNSPIPFGFGLNTVPGKYSFITGPATDEARCVTTLKVDHEADTAVLEGRLKNKDGAEIDLSLTFSNMHDCVGRNLNNWLNAWDDHDATPVEQGESARPWQCFSKVSGLVGGPGQALNQSIDNTPAVGAIRMRNNATDLGGFSLNVPNRFAPWLLGFRLYDGRLLDPVTEYKVVSCPKEGEIDAGDGTNEETQGRKDCVWSWYGDKTFVTSIENEPGLLGEVKVEGLDDIRDPRAHCGGNGVWPGVGDENYQLAPIGPNTGPQGLRIYPTPNVGNIDIPWYLCGITPDTGVDSQPFIRLINVGAYFERDIVNSVVIHDADGGAYGDPDGPVNADYDCDAATSNTDPVVAWLPRTNELPIYALSPSGIVQKTRQIRDVTLGCGSARGGSSTRSYLLSNLRYDGGAAGGDDSPSKTQLRNIIAGELSALDATLRQSQVCIDTTAEMKTGLFTDWGADTWAPGQAVDGSSFLAQLKAHYQAGDYTLVQQDLQWLLQDLVEGDRSRLYSGFDTCYYKNSKVYNEPTYPGLVASSSPSCAADHAPGDYCYPPASMGYVPRNFRGDMEAQVRHILWNIEQKLVPAP